MSFLLYKANNATANPINIIQPINEASSFINISIINYYELNYIVEQIDCVGVCF